MAIWLITGYTRQVGVWDVELFTSKLDAEAQFNYYIKDYEAQVAADNPWVATCKDGIGRFYLEERHLDI